MVDRRVWGADYGGSIPLTPTNSRIVSSVAKPGIVDPQPGVRFPYDPPRPINQQDRWRSSKPSVPVRAGVGRPIYGERAGYAGQFCKLAEFGPIPKFSTNAA